MKLGRAALVRDMISFAIFAGSLSSSQLTLAQTEPNFFSGHRLEGESRDSSEIGPSVQVPLHGNTDAEVLQLERSPSAAGSSVLEEPINPEQYICGRGDVFELNFWGAQNFKVRVTVDSEGRAFVPKVGYVDVVGKTLSQTRAQVKKAVSRFYPGLSFDLSLQQPRSFLVHLVGFVKKPGIFPATPIERVSSLLRQDGPLPRGSRRRIEVVRRDGHVVTADLWRYETTGDKSFNPYLMDGDTVRVPFAEVTVQIEGAVKRTGTVELIGAKDLAELLDVTGGVRPDVARTLPIRVVRATKDEQREQVSLPFAADGKAPNVGLHDGDSVFVPTMEELQRSILLVGPVPGATPTDEITSTKRLPFVAGMTVRSTVEGNGPLGASADLHNAYIKPEKGNIVPVDLEALLVRRDFSADRALHIGDTVVIPQRRRAVSVEGAAVRPGVYAYNPRFTIGQYLALAGGPSRMARSSSSFRVVKSDGSLHRANGGIAIEPGDTIELPERTFSRSEVVQLVMGGVGLLLSSAALIILVVK